MAPGDEGPPEKDVKDLRFQQLVNIRVSSPLDEVRTDRTQWLASSNKFGLIFVVVKEGFRVYKVEDICRVDVENARERSTHVVNDLKPWSLSNSTNPISHLAVSCDELTLIVASKECGNLLLSMFDVRQFAVKTENPVPFASCRVNASPGASIQEIVWNPTDPTLLAVCVSDGSVELVRVTESVKTVGSLPVSSNALCVCWSPKGRQLVIGRKNGTLTQFDQEMNEKRNWPFPSILESPHQAVDVMWISTYVFIVAYLQSTASIQEQPRIVLTVSSKDGPTSYVNFEDVCYGSGEDRKHKYYFTYLTKWEMVLLSSSNATETAIVGKHFDESAAAGRWEHWTLEDSGRAELPLTENTQDSFPMGATVNLASQAQIQLGDNKTHPPSPLLFLLSTDGMLVSYHIIYSHAQATSLTVPQVVLSAAGIRTAKVASTAVSTTTTTPGQPLQNPVSTLPTSGSSFQFVTKSTESSSETPGASLFAQPKTSALPTSGSSFQFVTKPVQSQSGHNIFAPVTTPAQSVPSSESQKSFAGFSFTPASSGASGSVLGKPLATTTAPAPAGVQSNKFTFGGESSAGTGFKFGASVTTSVPSTTTTASSLGSNTGLAKPALPTSGSGFTFGQTEGKPVFGGTPTTGGFGLSKTSTPASVPSTITATTTASFGSNLAQSKSALTTTGSGFVFGQTEGKVIFGGGLGPPKTSAPAVVTTSTTVSSSSSGTSLGGTPLLKAPADSAAPKPFGGLLGLNTSKNLQEDAVGIPATSATPVSQLDPPAASINPSPIRAGVKRDKDQRSDRPASPPSPTQPSTVEKAWVNETVESTFTGSIFEEMQHFEQELKDLKSRAGNSRSQVGGRQEMQDLRKNTEDMAKFCQDVKETVREQSHEVHDQKMLCLDLFAMAEECRVRQDRNNDPQYHKLLRSRALDPASAEKLKQLQNQYQSLEQGMADVELVLDQQWEDYQDKKRAIKGRLHAPTSDIIYRAVKSNHNLVQTQKSKLDQLQEKLKNLQLYNRTSDWQNNSLNLNTSRPADLTSLMNSLGQSTPQPCRVRPPGSKVSPQKLGQLREFLSQRAVPQIKSTKPANLSMSRIVAAKGLREKLEEVRSPRTSRSFQGLTKDASQRTADHAQPRAQSARPAQATSIQGMATASTRPGVNTFQKSEGNRGQNIQSSSSVKGLTTQGFGFSPHSALNNRGVNSEELSSAMLKSKQTVGLTYSGGGTQPDVEEISPGYTPELVSDEQNFSEDEEEEYDEEEEEEDEEEAGFGPEYSLDTRAEDDTVEDNEVAAMRTPSTTFPTATRGDERTTVSKNLFGSAAPVTSQSAAPSFGNSSLSSSGFTFGAAAGKAEQSSMPLFGGAAGISSLQDAKPSKEEATKDVPPPPPPAVGSTPKAKGFSFSTGGDTAPTSGFSFTSTSSTASGSGGGFKFGGTSGIFAKPTDSSQSESAQLSAFGAAGFGKKTLAEPESKNSDGGAATSSAVTAALNSSLLAALTDSTTVTSSSVTASAALGSSLLAALTDASSPAPQEAAAALRSFSFQPGESPSHESVEASATEEGDSGQKREKPAAAATSTSAIAVTSTSAAAVTSSAAVSAAANLFSLSSSGGFGQEPKFTGSPPGATTTASATTSTSAPLFGANPVQFGASGPSSFGALASAAQTSTASSVTTTTPSTPATSSSVVKSLFATPTAAATETLKTGFGISTTTSATTASGLGTSTATTSTSAFGSVSTSSSIFGGASATSSAFGTGLTGSGFGAGSGGIFGGVTAPTTSSSVFGGTTATTSSSVFGGTSSTNLFGTSTTATTSTTTSVFGAPTSGVATSGTGFGFGQTSSGGFTFGQSGFGQGSGFGSGSSGFGSGGSVFGQSTTTATSSVFGQPSSTTAPSAEGSVFGGSGGLFGGLGGKPSAEKANKNVFGGGTFGTTVTTQNSSLFGSTGSPAFGSTSSSGFGSAGFAAGTGGVGATGFGVTQAQSPQSSGGFGGPAAFGGSPSFGGKPAFGSPGAGFGSTAAFSNPVASPGTTFGSVSGQQAGFASFASSNSPTFGNLAQSNQPEFGSLGNQATTFGSSGGFGSTTGTGFGTQPSFGSPQPAFGGASNTGFGGTSNTGSFGSSPQFTSYRG